MKTPITRTQVRNLSLATLMAGAALFLGACATQPVALMPSDKPVATDEAREKYVDYKDFHGMMVRLASTPTPGDTVQNLETLASNGSGGEGAKAILASNQ